MELVSSYESLVSILLCFQVTLIRTMYKAICFLNNSILYPCERNEGRQTKVDGLLL